jgi:hypothetical protein
LITPVSGEEGWRVSFFHNTIASLLLFLSIAISIELEGGRCKVSCGILFGCPGVNVSSGPSPESGQDYMGGRCHSCSYVGDRREWGFVLFMANRTYAIRQSSEEAGILTFYLYPHLIPPKETGHPRGIIPHQERLAHRLNPGRFQPVLQP